MSAYSSVVLADSPISYWRLDDSSGTTAVDTQGVNNGTYVNSPTLGVPGLITNDADTAVSFLLGSSQDLTLPGPSLSSLTGSIEFWFTWTSGTALMRDQSSSGTSWIIGFANANQFAVRIANATTVNTTRSIASLQDGARHHLVLTCTGSGGTVIVYVDGIVVATFTAGTTAPAMPWNVARNGGNVQYTTMTADEIAIYSTVLSASRVGVHYTTGISEVKSVNSFSYWRRAGKILPAYTLGKVAGTGDFSYWERGGKILYPAAIPAAASPPPPPIVLTRTEIGQNRLLAGQRLLAGTRQRAGTRTFVQG